MVNQDLGLGADGRLGVLMLCAVTPDFVYDESDEEMVPSGQPLRLDADAVGALTTGSGTMHAVLHQKGVSSETAWAPRGNVRRGTVKLRPLLAEKADAEPVAQLPRIPFSSRDHQPRRLALRKHRRSVDESSNEQFRSRVG